MKFCDMKTILNWSYFYFGSFYRREVTTYIKVKYLVHSPFNNNREASRAFFREENVETLFLMRKFWRSSEKVIKSVLMTKKVKLLLYRMCIFEGNITRVLNICFKALSNKAKKIIYVYATLSFRCTRIGSNLKLGSIFLLLRILFKDVLGHHT